MAPSEVTQFYRKVISHSNNKIFQAWSLLLYASESTQMCATRVFFLSLFSCNFDDQLSPNLHIIICYFMHTFGYTKWEYWSLTSTKGVHAFNTFPYIKLLCQTMEEENGQTMNLSAHSAVPLVGSVEYGILFSFNSPVTALGMRARWDKHLLIYRFLMRSSLRG